MKLMNYIVASVIFSTSAVLTGCGDNSGKARIDIDLSKNPLPSEISDAKGFSSAESWGRWTDGEKAILIFKNPLPKNFDLVILAHAAFGPNANKPVKLKIGEIEHTFIVSTPDQTITIPATLKAETNTLEITPPAPASPRSTGASDDARLLGLAISKISIVPKL